MSELLSPAQEVCMIHLLSGQPKGHAARLAGVAPETLSRWLADEESLFVRLYAQRRASVWQAYEHRIAAMVPLALGALTSLMESEDHHDAASFDPRTRLRAAEDVLQMAGLLKKGPKVFAPNAQVNIGDQQVNVNKE